MTLQKGIIFVLIKSLSLMALKWNLNIIPLAFQLHLYTFGKRQYLSTGRESSYNKYKTTFLPYKEQWGSHVLSPIFLQTCLVSLTRTACRKLQVRHLIIIFFNAGIQLFSQTLKLRRQEFSLFGEAFHPTVQYHQHVLHHHSSSLIMVSNKLRKWAFLFHMQTAFVCLPRNSYLFFLKKKVLAIFSLCFSYLKSLWIITSKYSHMFSLTMPSHMSSYPQNSY